MTGSQVASLKKLEGLRVGVSCSDGSRFDDCELLGVLRARNAVWVAVNGRELMLPFDELRDVWEFAPIGASRRAERPSFA